MYDRSFSQNKPQGVNYLFKLGGVLSQQGLSLWISCWQADFVTFMDLTEIETCNNKFKQGYKKMGVFVWCL